MRITFGKKYTATATAFAARSVHCEHCGERYLYDVPRDGEGKGTSLFFLDNEGACARANARAQRQAQRRVQKDIELVPCPTCGSFQKNMVALIRRRHWRWLKFLGVPALVVCLLSFGLLQVANQNQESLELIAISAGALGVGLLSLRLLLASCHAPNAGNPEHRKQLGRTRAYRPADADRLVQDRNYRRSPALLKSAASDQLAVALLAGLFGLGALVGAGVFGYRGASLVHQGVASHDWPTVKGKIIASRRVEQRSKTSHTVRSEIRYTFTVEGRTYTSDNLWFGDFQKAESNLWAYPLGSDVTVHYQITDPSVSVLQPGARFPRSFLPFAYALPLLVVGIGLVWFGLFKYRRSREMSRPLFSGSGRQTWRAPQPPGAAESESERWQGFAQKAVPE
jgi:hypothetical protein